MFAHLSRTHQKRTLGETMMYMFAHLSRTHPKGVQERLWCTYLLICLELIKKVCRRDCGVYICSFVQNSSKRCVGETVVYIFAHLSRTHKKGVQERLCCIYLLICLELTARVVIVTNCVRPTEGVAACLDAFASNIQP